MTSVHNSHVTLATNLPLNAEGHTTGGSQALSSHQTIAGTTLHPATPNDHIDSTETACADRPLPFPV